MNLPRWIVPSRDEVEGVEGVAAVMEVDSEAAVMKAWAAMVDSEAVASRVQSPRKDSVAAMGEQVDSEAVDSEAVDSAVGSAAESAAGSATCKEVESPHPVTNASTQPPNEGCYCLAHPSQLRL